MSPVEVSAVYDDLRGDVCLCGGYKKPGKSFCRHHFFRLPKDLQDQLYQRAGYVETFFKCAAALKLKLREGMKLSTTEENTTHEVATL